MAVTFLGSTHLPSLPIDVVVKMTTCLKVSALMIFRQINTHGEKLGSHLLVNRARTFGYQEEDSDGANQYLRNLFEEVKHLFTVSIYDGYSYIKTVIEPENTLMNLETTPAELCRLSYCPMAMESPSLREFLFYNLVFLSKKQDLKFTEDIKKYGTVILIYASATGAQDITKLMLDQGIDINYQNASGTTALIAAAGFSSTIEFFKFLIENGADIHHEAKDGKTPLSIVASGSNTIKHFKLLTEKGARFNPSQSPLLWVQSAEITRELIQLGADVNAEELGDTPLINQCRRGDHRNPADESFEICRLLIEAGAHVNYKGEQGDTPLYLATLHGDKNLVALLLKHRADVNIPSHGRLPIESARFLKLQDIVDLLESHY